MALDPRIEAIRKEYELDAADFWQIPQNKQWVCKHSALELVAVKANIEWSPPQVIEADTAAGIAVIAVTGLMGSRGEWSTGEASPKNNKNAYPWAMAEKRAKDRVILKLVGLHGLVYSEDEADDFKAPAPAPQRETKPKAQARAGYEELQAEIDACTSLDDLAMLWSSPDFKLAFKLQPADWQEHLIDRKEQAKAAFEGKPYIPPDFDALPPETQQAANLLRA